MFRRLKECYPCLIDDVETLIAEFYEQHLALLHIDTDTSHLLGALGQAGIQWGIVTNGSRNQFLKVQRLGLDVLTPCVLVSEVAGFRKPYPEIFHAAASLLAVEPSDISIVGDNPETDIMGAASVGMQTAWIQRGQPWPTHLAPSLPTHTITSLSELLWVARKSGQEDVMCPVEDRAL